MALSPSCNLVANPSFETGSLAPWFTTTTEEVAQVANGTLAYSGDYYLDLKTAVGNRGNTFTQLIDGLRPGSNYTFSIQAQTTSIPGANYCGVYAYMGHNATIGSMVSELIFDGDEWIQFTGTHQARRPREVLNIVGSCTYSGSSVTGHVLFDDIFLGEENCRVLLD